MAGPREANEPGKVRQPSLMEWHDKPCHSAAKLTQPERSEVRPVTRGKRLVKSRCRLRGNGADAKLKVAVVSAPRPARCFRQEVSEPGEEASLKRFRLVTAETVPP